MLKQYLTDGLIQIAIVLSLLRTDIITLNSNYVNYPEVQEIIQGQTVAYTQTNFHHSFHQPFTTHLGSPEIYRKDVIEPDYPSIFSDLRSFHPFERTFQNADLQTFLLVGGASNRNAFTQQPLEQNTNEQESENEDENNNNIDNSNTNSLTLDNLHEEGQNLLNVLEENIGAIAPLVVETLQAADPTSEDLDLIEVLWRQDIDLGVGKDVFDPNLRRELEREREIELQKERQKQKEQEQLQAKLEEQRRNAQQRWLNDNFTQDGETGEWVPLGGSRVPPPPAPELGNMPQAAQQYMPSYEGYQMMGDGLPQQQENGTTYPGIPNHPPPQYPSQANMTHPQQQGMYGMNPVGQYNHVGMTANNAGYGQTGNQRACTMTAQGYPGQNQQAPVQYNNTGNYSQNNYTHMQARQPQQQQSGVDSAGYPRQMSLEATWQDLVNILDLPTNRSAQNASMPLPSQTHNMATSHNINAHNAINNINNTMATMGGHGAINNNSMAGQMGHTGCNNSLPMCSMGQIANTSSMLIQNATMPTPPMRADNDTFNGTGLVSQCHRSPAHSSGMLSPCAVDGTLDNSSLATSSQPGAGLNGAGRSSSGMGPLDWSPADCEDLLFPNISSELTGELTGGADPLDVEDVEELLPDLITEDELDDIDFDIHLSDGGVTPTPSGRRLGDDASSDSAVSMGSQSVGSPQSDLSDGAMSPFDGLEGATGGHDGSSFPKTSKYDPDDFKYGNSCSYSSGGDSNCSSNFSSNSNDTGCGGGGQFGGGHDGYGHASNGHINHNHSYPLKPGQDPKDFKKHMFNNNNNKEGKHKGPHSKDYKRIDELKIPYSVDQIVDTPVEEFNEMLTRVKFNDQQLQLIRDIRRRGKNKVAAQNCRKRKIGVLEHLEDEMTTLERMRDKLLHDRHMMDKQTREMKEKLGLMYGEIFHSLRDEHGHPYDPSRFSLQQSSDGDVFLVPRNYTTDETDPHKKKKSDK